MKITLDLGETEVPKVIIDKWKKHKREYGDIEEFIRENAWEFLSSYEGKLVDRDLAIFLRDYEVDNIPRQGGYSAGKEFSFKDAGNKYTILAFGWNDENGEPAIHMIGYKESKEFLLQQT